VLDYRIYYAQLGSEYSLLVQGVTTTSYTTIVSLITNEQYKFKVQARNAVGYSLDSSEITVRVARKPDVPTSLATAINGDFVKISWAAPYDGGSPLLSYTIQILQSDSVSFTADLMDCDGANLAILSSGECNVPIYTLI